MLIDWTIAPAQNIMEARMIDHLRPYFAVKGQMKKQEKKAVGKT